MHRFWQQRIAEIDRRALNDRAGLVDHDAKPPVFGEEGQAVPAGIGIDPTLGPNEQCYRNAAPAAVPVMVDMYLVQGQGMVGAQVYKK